MSQFLQLFQNDLEPVPPHKLSTRSQYGKAIDFDLKDMTPWNFDGFNYPSAARNMNVYRPQRVSYTKILGDFDDRYQREFNNHLNYPKSDGIRKNLHQIW